MLTPAERFASLYTVTPEGHWLWKGYTRPRNRYGRFWIGGACGKYVGAHRWSWQTKGGTLPPGEERTIPRGYDVHHLPACGIEECVRPGHLRPIHPRAHKRAHGCLVAVCPKHRRRKRKMGCARRCPDCWSAYMRGWRKRA